MNEGQGAQSCNISCKKFDQQQYIIFFTQILLSHCETFLLMLTMDLFLQWLMDSYFDDEEIIQDFFREASSQKELNVDVFESS